MYFWSPYASFTITNTFCGSRKETIGHRVSDLGKKIQGRRKCQPVLTGQYAWPTPSHLLHGDPCTEKGIFTRKICDTDVIEINGDRYPHSLSPNIRHTHDTHTHTPAQLPVVVLQTDELAMVYEFQIHCFPAPHSCTSKEKGCQNNNLAQWFSFTDLPTTDKGCCLCS